MILYKEEQLGQWMSIGDERNEFSMSLEDVEKWADS